jgi:hypothetical protein
VESIDFPIPWGSLSWFVPVWAGRGGGLGVGAHCWGSETSPPVVVVCVAVTVVHRGVLFLAGWLVRVMRAGGWCGVVV